MFRVGLIERRVLDTLRSVHLTIFWRTLYIYMYIYTKKQTVVAYLHENMSSRINTSGCESVQSMLYDHFM